MTSRRCRAQRSGRARMCVVFDGSLVARAVDGIFVCLGRPAGALVKRHTFGQPGFVTRIEFWENSIMPTNKDYYKALGVSQTATADEIKKAYREVAKKYHPDLHPGDKAAEEKFKEVSEAYDTLGDADKRKKYDQFRKLGGGSGMGGFGFGGGGSSDEMSYEEFMRRYGTAAQRERHGGGQSTGAKGFGDFSIDDLFGNLFGRKAKTASPETNEPVPTDDPFFRRKGNDAYVDLSVNIAQAALGSKVRVRTPSGKKVTVKIMPGTDPGKVLRIPGMGFGGGDMYIRVNVVVPKNLTPEQAALMEQLAEALGLRH